MLYEVASPEADQRQDDNIEHGAMPFKAHVRLRSRRPTLFLEEIEHMLDEVHCNVATGGQSSIVLKFRGPYTHSAWKALKGHHDFLLITSHHSCNQKGSRLPFR